ncbi:DUF4845 domain-containing protein [Pseudoteredinibacter isoporae]|uniref:DUF4845 domain-containing protein n=1 Tax=Pseudoteredinibacter isoporae TaxID=570281 RepID=A0A7X0MXQ3_9GAMM|nr:DUF4845 domain-containing protein [Pseudoteredinibacter isoporae]MBB6523713.1 hypothetical protein [Pseudoteredinibacter isoporae]NHO89216.1 DUF4845 domain-containing protein [Pseudoteredinibacter isoporae]NIB22173.1 DUF4845 domain-containing protein [Pseudoteredinibacter isoporae]
MSVKNLSRQAGMSLTTMLVMVFIFGSMLLFLSQTVPAFIDDRFVKATLKSLTSGSMGIVGKSPRVVRDNLSKQFGLNNVRTAASDPKNWEIERIDEHYIVIIDYEVRNNLISNIDVVMHFRHRLDTRSPELCCTDRAKR